MRVEPIVVPVTVQVTGSEDAALIPARYMVPESGVRNVESAEPATVRHSALSAGEYWAVASQVTVLINMLKGSDLDHWACHALPSLVKDALGAAGCHGEREHVEWVLEHAEWRSDRKAA